MDPDPEVERILARLQRSKQRLAELRRGSSITRWNVGVWILSGALGLGGIILTPISGGASLILTALGVVLVLIDMTKQIRDNAKTAAEREAAELLLGELDADLDRLRSLVRRGAHTEVERRPEAPSRRDPDVGGQDERIRPARQDDQMPSGNAPNAKDEGGPTTKPEKDPQRPQ